METENFVLMRMARESLKGRWSLAIGTCVVYFLISGILSAIPGVGSLISLLVTGPFMVGMAIFSLAIARNQDAKLEQIFNGFNNFGPPLVAYLLMILYIFLWMLLLIIPGIIAAFAYSQTFYILAENPDIKPQEALRKSKEMMMGYKMKFFELQLRFFGWALLCILTLGIGFLWLFPYIQVSQANFYDDLKLIHAFPEESTEAPPTV